MKLYTWQPVGSTPVLLSVSPNPIVASADAGASTPFVIEYADPDLDILLLRIVEISDPEDAITVGEVPVDDLATEEAGTFTLFAECDATAPDRCTVGTAIVDVRLVDRAGNESAPVRVTITFQ